MANAITRMLSHAHARRTCGSAIHARAGCYPEGMAAQRDPAHLVTFFELAGAGARDELAALGERASAAGAACELLVSETQEDLWLLVCRGGPLTDAPAGARTWRFRRVGVRP